MSATAHSPDDQLFRHVVDVLPVATAVVDRAGLVVASNRAFCEVLQLDPDDVEGEPLLGWIRAGERAGFGRAFMALRERDPGSGFVLDVGFSPRLGPPVDCVLRTSKLADGHVAVTCHPASATRLAPEAELGLAITRSLDALDQGVMLVDDEGRIVHANPAGTKLLGDGIVGRSFLELAEPDAVGRLTRALTVGRAGSWHGEVGLRRLDGEPLPVELSLAAGTGPAVILVRDIRGRRRREFETRLVGQVDRCLAASAEPRQSVLSACAALGQGIGASRVVLVVRAVDGWERWEVEVRPHPLSDDAVPSDKPDGRPSGSRSASVSDGRSGVDAGGWAQAEVVTPCDPDDPEVVRAFGSTPKGSGGGDASRALRVVLRAPGGVVGYLLMVRGSTDAWDERDVELSRGVASQLALGLANGLLALETRELATYQSMVLDQTSVLFDTVDAHGCVVTWNLASQQLLGIPEADAIGRRFGIDVARAVDGWEGFWTELLAKGVLAREMSLCDADGHEVPLHLEGRILRGEGSVRGAVIVGLDLRDRRALESQVLRSQKLAAVGLLAAGIAHEINNPLSGVVGYSKLLLEGRLNPEVRERVEKIAQSGERCRKIVEGVLLFSRKQDGGTRRSVDLRGLLDRVIAIGEYQWRMHNIRIIREIDDAVSVHADADQLEQVILNLLSNAVDAMPRGGSVRIALRRMPNGSAQLRFADQGHGIPEEIQARIFDPFFSTKEIGKGTGLGLAISYGIVQDHGGDIRLESSEQGATFIVTLPAEGAAAQSQSSSKPPPSQRQSQSQPPKTRPVPPVGSTTEPARTPSAPPASPPSSPSSSPSAKVPDELGTQTE